MVEYIPDRGDVVWLSFNPQKGHEQTGRRPALVLTPASYNAKVGLAIFCPVTSKQKGYPFEVIIPDDYELKGVVLSDQVKNLDWRARDATFICKLSHPTMIEVSNKLKALLPS